MSKVKREKRVTDTTEKKLRNLKPFKPGQSGNPAGRPKGSRNKLNEMFLRDLQALWDEHGDTILLATMKTKPEAILKAMEGLLPKHQEATQKVDVDIKFRKMLEVMELEYDQNKDATKQLLIARYNAEDAA